jgi:hypothetical protein
MTLLDHWKAIYLLVLPALSAAIAVSLFGVAGGRAPNDLARHCDFFLRATLLLRGVTLTGIKG